MKYFVKLRQGGSNVDGNQEMEPFASKVNEDNYGTTTDSVNYVFPTNEAGIEYESLGDTPDFSIQRTVQGLDAERKAKIQNLPPLNLSNANATSAPVFYSPDSDKDILGYIDHTPDPLVDAIDYVGSNSYSKIYHLKPFSELMPGSFVPSCPILLNVTKFESAHSNIGLNIFNTPFLIIDLEHGDHKWSIKKKVSQVTGLHAQLHILRTKLKLPAATKEARIRRQSMRIQMKNAHKVSDVQDGRNVNTRLLKFPRRALQTMDKNALSDLQIYLRNLLCHSLFRNYATFLDFLEISPVSFVNDLGKKNKEGYVRKRMGGYSSDGCCTWCWSPCTGRYKQRWLVLKETCMFFLAPETGEVRSVMLMDSYFQVSHGYRIVGVRNAVLISNLSRSMIFKCDSESSQKEWVKHITRTEHKYAREFTRLERRFDSFAPVREGSYARWYVDGARYMWDVAEILESAKEEIFITDWWMSPQIYLKRPDLTGLRWRLAEVLKRQAERGVKVFILLYKEVELALGINSILTKQTLSQLHENIKILRHPDHTAGGTLYWAHHEKIVVVDQMYAFVSGIDLAFGRWDNSKHKLVDIGHAGVHPIQIPEIQTSTKSQNALGTSALSQLVKVSSDVIVSPVTNSTSNSRKSSINVSCSEDQTLNTTVSTLSSQFEEKYVHKKEVQESQSIFLHNTKELEMNAQVKATGNHSGFSDPEFHKGYHSDSEDHPLSAPENTTSSAHDRKHVKKKRFLRRDVRFARSAAAYNRTIDDEVHGPEGRMGKGLKEVRKIGLDLVEEVKVKGRGVKAWTATKLPNLHRRNSSESEYSELDETDNGQRRSGKSFYKSHRRKFEQRMRMGSTSSLAQAHNALAQDDSPSVHLWVGKDYVNWINKDLTNLDEPFKDIVNRRQTPRMPWHDIGLFVEGPSAKDVARHFIQRWNAVKTEKAKPDPKYQYLVPKTYHKDTFKPSLLEPKHLVKCQVVRSVGRWSAGLEESEYSIFTAYVNLIREAKHYIYIENQFFISCTNVSEAKDVTNSVAQELIERIVLAHSNGEDFRVYVLLPLLPAFEGNIGEASGIAMQFIVYWNYVTISRGKTSLIECLKERGISEWNKYISFCSLRNHEEMEGRPISELIYIHSKLMIVDDRYVIAGSANINDRSLIGNRDSEVCLVMEDEEFEAGTMNGQPYECGVFAGGMRKYLFLEHLGMEETESSMKLISDPIAQEFFTDVWCKTATKNAKLFEEVFCCYPCNSATTFEDVNRIRNTKSLAELSPHEARIKAKDIQGHLVEFPLDFLKDEVLKPGVGTKEYLLPMETWT